MRVTQSTRQLSIFDGPVRKSWVEFGLSPANAAGLGPVVTAGKGESVYRVGPIVSHLDCIRNVEARWIRKARSANVCNGCALVDGGYKAAAY